MVTSLSKKEKKVSYTTVNTFSNSIQTLFTRLQSKFTPADVKVFFQITKPLPNLPVESVSELSLLMKLLCKVYEEVCFGFFSIFDF